MEKSPTIVGMIEERQKEIGMMILHEMDTANATRGTVETEIVGPRGKFLVTTTLTSL